MGFLNAYLVRDSELCSKLTEAEFEMVFSEIQDSRGWDVRDLDGEFSFLNRELNGKILLHVDFVGDVRIDGSMDTVLDMLRANM